MHLQRRCVTLLLDNTFIGHSRAVIRGWVVEKGTFPNDNEQKPPFGFFGMPMRCLSQLSTAVELPSGLTTLLCS